MKIRILLADDHAIFRHALRMSLERYSDIDIVGEVIDGGGILEAVLQIKPEIICMDFSMPKLNGIEASKQLVSAVPGVKIICLSAHIDLGLVSKMIQVGARGFVDKVQAATELHNAIHAVYQNKFYFSPRLGITEATIPDFNLCQDKQSGQEQII
jgi:DNA-binding NarL/FixJ family response regulator